MIVVTKYASTKLLNILSDNLHKSSEYGSPPIFYWFRNMTEETYKIDSYHYFRSGDFQYKLGYSLGVAHVKCEFVGKQRVLIITDYDINTRALFSWKNRSGGDSGLIPKQKKPYQRKPYRRLTKKSLFGYNFVMNDKKEYNLIDNNGNLLTQWFRAIKPFTKPYGRYNIIAYVNISGYMYALGYNGKVYNLDRTWGVSVNECIRRILSEALKMLHKQQLSESRGNIVRINEQQLQHLINGVVRQFLIEYRDSQFCGWDCVKRLHKKGGASKFELDHLKLSYDKYAEEQYKIGKTPNCEGFEDWCFDQEYKAQKRGVRNLYPTYWAID